jgi:hypothetical protein
MSRISDNISEAISGETGGALYEKFSFNLPLWKRGIKGDFIIIKVTNPPL